MKHPETAQLAREARAKLGMTQRAFAELLWTGQRTIMNWESGEKPPVGPVLVFLNEIRNGIAPAPAMKRRVARHYAGKTADGEFAVDTIVSDKGDPSAYRRKPCEDCPWRSDVPTGRFPADAFRHSARTAYDMAETMFSCHVSGSEKPATCAGFLLRGAGHNMLYRLALISGKIDPREISDAGIPLYAGYREMAIANGVDPDDPVLSPCR